MYEIKNYKTFKGHEGEPCAQGTIALGNKKVADWSDDSWGGDIRIDFFKREDEAAFVTWAKTFLATRKDYEDKLYDVNTLSPWDLQSKAVFHMSVEHAMRKTLLRDTKKGIVARIQENGVEETYTFKLAYTVSNVQKLREKYGANLLEVYNETFGMALEDEATAKLKAENARYKKLCKTNILFTVRKESGELVVMKTAAVYSAVTAAGVRQRNPNLVEIINERYL